MDVDQLRTLVAAAEEGSLTAAGRRRNLTQPAVSLQVKAMEEELGTPLFHRRGRGVTLTRAGEVVVGHAREVLHTLDVARSEVAEMLGLVGGTLHLGVTDAAATGLLPRAFAAFHRLHPGVEVRVAVHPTAELASGLERGELDLAVATLPEETRPVRDLEVEPLVSEPLGFVIPCDARRVPLAVLLEREPFIAYPGGSTTRGLIDRALDEAGLVARPRMEIGRPDVMIRLVEAGLGVAVLPLEVSEPALRRGTVHRPSPRRFKVDRRLGLLSVPGRRTEPAARAFADILRRST